MADPGYGSSGALITPVGLTSWVGSGPPILKRQLPAAAPSITLGFGSIPRKMLAGDEAITVKRA